MKFKVISKSKNGYLVLSSEEKRPIINKVPIFLNGEKAAEVFDTIGRVDSPLYLAKQLMMGKQLVGRELDNKNI